MTNKKIKRDAAQRARSDRVSRRSLPGGFTLIETLLAVFILSTAIAGPLTIAQKGLTATLVAKDQTSAFLLAQDAVEYVRYVRDSNCLVAGPQVTGCPVGVWFTGLVSCTNSTGTAACYFDSLSPADPLGCAVSGCPLMQYDPTSGVYQYTTGPNSIFTRTVKITNPSASGSYEAVVEVTVSWRDAGARVHSIVVRENILDWQ